MKFPVVIKNTQRLPYSIVAVFVWLANKDNYSVSNDLGKNAKTLFVLVFLEFQTMFRYIFITKHAFNLN